MAISPPKTVAIGPDCLVDGDKPALVCSAGNASFTGSSPRPLRRKEKSVNLRRFNAGFRIGTVSAINTRSGSTCTYNVVINNQPIPVTSAAPPLGAPSFRNTLSSGDRNTLALAFFFALLDNDPSLASRIVVIDDPITSLDEHRSLTTVQEMRHLSQRTAQVIVLSHDKPFYVASGKARTAINERRSKLPVTVPARPSAHGMSIKTPLLNTTAGMPVCENTKREALRAAVKSRLISAL